MPLRTTPFTQVLRATWLQATGRPLRYYHLHVAVDGGAIAYVVPFATPSLLRHEVIAEAVNGGTLRTDESRNVILVDRIEAAEYLPLVPTEREASRPAWRAA